MDPPNPAPPSKKPKQQQSCDACRIRKVKCEPPPGTSASDFQGQDRGRFTCKHCLGVGLTCEFLYVPKKRGPPNLYVKRLELAKAQGIPLSDLHFERKSSSNSNSNLNLDPESGTGTGRPSLSSSNSRLNLNLKGSSKASGSASSSSRRPRLKNERSSLSGNGNANGNGKASSSNHTLSLGLEDENDQEGLHRDQSLHRDQGLHQDQDRGNGRGNGRGGSSSARYYDHDHDQGSISNFPNNPAHQHYGYDHDYGTTTTTTMAGVSLDPGLGERERKHHGNNRNNGGTGGNRDQTESFERTPVESGIVDVDVDVEIEDETRVPGSSTGVEFRRPSRSDYDPARQVSHHHVPQHHQQHYQQHVDPAYLVGMQLPHLTSSSIPGRNTANNHTNNNIDVDLDLDIDLDIDAVFRKSAPDFVLPATNTSLTTTTKTDPSPMIYERSGVMKYVVTPSESGSVLGVGVNGGGTGGGTYGQNHSNLGVGSALQGGNQTETGGISISYNHNNNHNDNNNSHQADGGPSTMGSDHISLPVHELQSGTLGDIGRFYPSTYGASQYASPPDGFHNLSGSGASPSISSLLNHTHNHTHNPDPLSRSSLLPYSQQPRSPIDAVLPRPLLHTIIGLFKDFVYPLTPCIHMPTLVQDLAKRREMEPGQEEWTAMVLATVMSTVVQVPRAFVPLSRGEVSALAERCYMETRRWSHLGYSDDSLTVNSVIVCYFRTIFNYVRDRSVSSCHASLCEAQALATVLKLHEEDSYTFLNPIEREIRRRIFFLLFCADKSESVLLGRPVKMREEDCFTLRLPEELDDEYITEARYLQQPTGVTSLITGLNAAVRIYCLIGRTLTKWRDDKRTRPTGARLDARIDEVDRLLEEVMGIMRGCPPELRLRGGMDSRVQSPSREFAKDAEQVLQELFFDPKASREYARDAYLVQAGNIYVNQQLARFVLLQYQNELIGLKNAYESRASRAGPPHKGWINAGGMSIGGVVAEPAGPERLPGPTSRSAVEGHLAANEETLFYDLLTVLHSIPIQCIAVNGPSLVNSVRYIASALLDTVAMNSSIESDTNKSSSQQQMNSEQNNSVLRAQGYLIDFLTILSDIEKHYSWTNGVDDPSA